LERMEVVSCPAAGLTATAREATSATWKRTTARTVLV
jgi:hypothetical protein